MADYRTHNIDLSDNDGYVTIETSVDLSPHRKSVFLEFHNKAADVYAYGHLTSNEAEELALAILVELKAQGREVGL